MERGGRLYRGLWVLVVVTTAFIVTGCSDDGDEKPSAEISAFCPTATELSGSRPESYVGSPQHVDDVERLLAVSPPAVEPEVRVYRDFLAGGGVDPDVPDSNLRENWPAEVQEAVTTVAAYIGENCATSTVP